MWLADDDWLGPEVIAACARRLPDRPDHLLVCPRSRYVRDGEQRSGEAGQSRSIDLPERASPAFYRTVTLNGPFYGLMRGEELMRVATLRPSNRSDWLVVASMALQGKVATLPDVAINRSLGGASRDAASLGRATGLSRERHATGTCSWRALPAVRSSTGPRSPT